MLIFDVVVGYKDYKVYGSRVGIILRYTVIVRILRRVLDFGWGWGVGNYGYLKCI